MKKIIILSLLAVFLVLPKVADSYYMTSDGHKMTLNGKHFITPNPAQASLDTVYTLNIALSNAINHVYSDIRGTDASVNELQFHADHATSLERVTAWLLDEYFYKNYPPNYHGTVIANNQFWLVKEGKRHRVYDLPTLASWGLVYKDAVWIPSGQVSAFKQFYPEGEPLQYGQGLYHDQVDKYLRGLGRQSLPQRLVDEFDAYITDDGKIDPTVDFRGNVILDGTYFIRIMLDSREGEVFSIWAQSNPHDQSLEQFNYGNIWFYIENGKARPIFDYPTALTHGVTAADVVGETFWPLLKSNYGTPLSYWEGEYYNEVKSYLKGDTDQDLPSDIKTALDNFEVCSLDENKMVPRPGDNEINLPLGCFLP